MTTTPAPTIAPEPLAIDVIVEYLGKGDSLSADLWKYCTNQWETLYFAFDPENYFYELNQNAITEPDDEDVTVLQTAIPWTLRTTLLLQSTSTTKMRVWPKCLKPNRKTP